MRRDAQGRPCKIEELINEPVPHCNDVCDADPLFVDPDGPDHDPETFDDNNYRLGAGSACIDAADNAAVPKRVTLDLDGNPRFVDDPDTEDTGRCGLQCERAIVDMRRPSSKPAVASAIRSGSATGRSTRLTPASCSCCLCRTPRRGTSARRPPAADENAFCGPMPHHPAKGRSPVGS